MKPRNLLCLIILAIQLQNTQAQVDLQNTGIIYVSGGTDVLYINGNFTNTSAAAFTNNGLFYVRQTLTNGQASMTTGTGTLYLNGTTAQSVAGTQPFKTYNLVTDNTSGITLNNDLTVAAVHTFTNGIIASSATPNYLIYEASSSYTGSADARHVSGWVKKIGSTNFSFPVGNGTVERRAGISNLSVSGEFDAKHFGTTPNTSNLAVPIAQVDPNEYWVINKISGGSANVDLNWDNSKVTFPPYALSTIRVAYYTAGQWTNVGGSATGDSFSSGDVSSNSVSSFGSFVIGSTSIVLPLQLVKFSARRKNNTTQVMWTTERESNLSHFEIQRSDDGISFYPIGQAKATNTLQARDYVYTDLAPIKNIAHYRLKTIDSDSKFSYSGIATVYDRRNNSYFTVSNPVLGKNIIIRAGADHNGIYNYYLSAPNGQLIQTGKLSMINGGTYSIPVKSSLTPGFYLLRIDNNLFKQQHKILIQ
jgi:hypothetical protein